MYNTPPPPPWINPKTQVDPLPTPNDREVVALHARAADLIEALDRLSAAEMRGLDTAQLRRFEAMCWHWASLAENELQERRRASREEESE